MSRSDLVMQLRSLGPGDVAFAVEQHLSMFPDGFFANLGRPFMREYYRSFLSSPSARGWVGLIDHDVVAYLVGTVDPKSHRTHVIRRHGVRLTLLAAAALTVQPRLFSRFARTRLVRYSRRLGAAVLPRRRPDEMAVASAQRVSVLSHVVVLPSARGRGMGRMLVDRLVTEAEAAGCQRIDLVTRAVDGAAPFYTWLGWKEVGSHRTVDGLELTRFTLPLSDPRR